jgi:hypothetical protein
MLHAHDIIQELIQCYKEEREPSNHKKVGKTWVTKHSAKCTEKDTF